MKVENEPFQGNSKTCPLRIYFRWTPHRVIVDKLDNGNHFRVLLCSQYTITGWGGGVLLTYALNPTL